MIIKQLYQNYGIEIDKIILSDYKKLGLKYVEATMLLVLLSMYRKKNTFSIAMLAKKTDLKKEKVEEITYSLMKNGFMTIDLENTKDGKEREVFNIDNTFDILERFLLQQAKDAGNAKISQTIDLLETELNRILTDNELETLRSFYEEERYTHEDILKAINIAKDNNKLSLKIIEKILINDAKVQKVEVDEKTKKALDDIFKAIK
ncbi:DnaD domain protein [Acholeplasma sp. OttesenSCG-928-E16]|nr:DnaD domain protein [Acholeplasma sp. OttesenSCG-928-E16]